MESHRSQLNLYRDDPFAIARAYREAAETELRNPYFQPEVRRMRHDYYLSEAQRIEGQAYR